MLVSEALARFAAELRYENIPDAIRERARLLMLDAIGVAFASSTYDFAAKALTGLDGSRLSATYTEEQLAADIGAKLGID